VRELKMARKKKSTITIIGDLPTQHGGEVAIVPGGKGVELQSLKSFFFGSKEIDFDQFSKQWNKIRDQIGTLLVDISRKSFGSMELDEVEVNIGVSGEGSIGIVSAKGEASLVLKFKRKE
jgi:hypothetical protein